MRQLIAFCAAAVLIPSPSLPQTAPSSSQQPMHLDDPRHPTAKADKRMVGDMTFEQFSKEVLGGTVPQSISFPPGNSDAQFGIGYDSVFAITKQPCVVYGGNPSELVTVGGLGQSVTLHLTHATTSQEFSQSLNLGAQDF